MTTTFTDEMMRERLAQARTYTAVILHKTDRYGIDETKSIIWEHGRRNMGLGADGILPIVCPVNDGTDMAGVGIFVGDLATVRAILDEDPAVQAGILSYEAHECRGFPGSTLPEPVSA